MNPFLLPHILQSPLLRAVPGVYHAFPGIDPLHGRGSRERLREVFSVPPSRVGTLRQVHSGRVLKMTDADADVPGRRWREGDAIWTADPGTGVGVRTADCVPILLAHPGIPVCAAVHAGWRGMAAGIVAATVGTIAERFGSSAVAGLVAAAGPAAKGCCYEIDEDVASRLRACPGGSRRLSRGAGEGKWMADLQGMALDALLEAGLSPSRIEAVGPCTICSPAHHSFRREKSLTGRHLSFIYRWDFSRDFPISQDRTPR